MVVDDEDPDAVRAGRSWVRRPRWRRRPGASASAGRPAIGRPASSRVPPPRGRSMRSEPPSSVARACIDSRPVPGVCAGGQPAAVVDDLDAQLVRRRSTGPGTSAPPRGGPRWSAPRRRSDRRRPRPRRAGRGSGSGGPATVIAGPGPAFVVPSSRAACCSIAPRRPSSSSAGGRRPSTSRRMSASVVWTSVPSSSSSRRAVVGVGRQELGGGLRAQADGRQRRTEPVMEVVAKPATLLLAGEEQALMRAGEVRAEAQRPDGDRRPGAPGPPRARAHPHGSRAPRAGCRDPGCRPARSPSTIGTVTTASWRRPCSATMARPASAPTSSRPT